MKKIIFCLFPITSLAFGQHQSGRILFSQGKTYEITLESKSNISQQAMGQAIDFDVDATGTHSYTATSINDDFNTLNHQVDRISFSFDGMGQKRKFDSNNEKDLNGNMGKSVRELLSKKYTVVIDSTGKTMKAIPEKIEWSGGDASMAIISSMMKDVIDLVQPPKAGAASFFKVLPDGGANVGEAWTESMTNENGKTDAAYRITAVTDSTVLIEFASTANTVTKAQMMGNETTTSMNSKSKGQITVDRLTGIIREKTISTESSGNTETSFGTLPVTAKSTTTITVTPVDR